MLRNVEKLLRNIENKTEKGILEASKIILQEAKKIVPKDTGALEDSGKITKIKDGYRISFQAFSEKGYDYAPIQHENLEFKHSPGRTAKYLELPIKRNIKKIEKIIERNIDK